MRAGRTSQFVKIAEDNLNNLIVCEKQIDDLKAGLAQFSSEAERANTELEYFSKRDEAENYACIVVVFAAMSVETLIYDFATEKFTDSFVKKYIDKLDIMSKWVLVPQLITGQAFPRDKKIFESLGKLVRERNNLVHFKSFGPHGDKDEDIMLFVEKMKTADAALLDSAKSAVQTIKELTAYIYGKRETKMIYANKFINKDSSNCD